MVLHPQTFRTEIPIRPLTHRLLRHEQSLLLLGSCFSEGVGDRLRATGHDDLSNPRHALQPRLHPPRDRAHRQRLRRGILGGATL